MPICTETGLAYDRAGPADGVPIVLLHAGVADRRMWTGVLPALAAEHPVLTLDLRGFGESVVLPTGPWSPRFDVLATLNALGIDHAHLVGCSFGAGVAVEAAVERPLQVDSLVLAAPGGSLIGERTDDLRSFIADENAALNRGDLDAAAEANVRTWVDGPRRAAELVSPAIRDAVRAMQRRAFEITQDWPDSVWEAETELDPPALDRLGQVSVPTLVVTGDHDLDAISLAADNLIARLPNARREKWPDVAHLPPMERADAFGAAVLQHISAGTPPN